MTVHQDPAFFRRLFRRATGLTPAAYRRKYAGLSPATLGGTARFGDASTAA
jgi:methylphosphotriester-DNA--protein-cysteine methyltransferase